MVHLLLVAIYLAYISLGLPDSLLGAAWPAMYPQLDVPISYAGILSVIISCSTVLSSLLSGRIIARLGTGRVTAFSVLLTAGALLAFSVGNSFWVLCFLAIPYGLGAGCVDTALNNYVAIHYESRHMSWLHCMWGLGASAGPYIMGQMLAASKGWPSGYRAIGFIQLALAVVVFISLPLWDKKEPTTVEHHDASKLSFLACLRLPGAVQMILSFFFYCALEQTMGLWAGSYLTLSKGMTQDAAARFTALFFAGITVGRALSGFATLRIKEKHLISGGFGIIALGVAVLLLPLPPVLTLAGLFIVGFGCAPIYPCLIHLTPHYFSPQASATLMGLQIASAYLGSFSMPSLFGFFANQWGTQLFPVFLFAMLVLVGWMYAWLLKLVSAKPQ